MNSLCHMGFYVQTVHVPLEGICDMGFYRNEMRTTQICDMIKRNESDVGHIVFEILAKRVFKFLCFILFLALTNSS